MRTCHPGNVEGLKVLNLIGTAIKEVPSSVALLKNLKNLHIRGFNGTSTSFYSMLTIHNPVNVSGLSASLICLRLHNYNLWTIPSDFGYWFSSLEELDLRRNHLVSLPYSITQLSQSKCTTYDDCYWPQWQSIPSLPLFLCFLYGQYMCFPEGLNGFSMVKWIQYGDLFLTHGSEIPKWFNNQRIGHKVNIQVPSCYGRDERMGIALCIVLVPDGPRYSRDFGYK